MARITQLAEQRQVPIRVAVLGVLRCEMGAARSRPSGVFGPVLSPPWHGCYSKAAREEERRFRTQFPVSSRSAARVSRARTSYACSLGCGFDLRR